MQARYCGACGTKLSQQSATTNHAGVGSGSALRGERKLVTVLFADLVSSTEMVAQLDAEEAMGRLRPALETMCRAVQSLGGTVFSKMGDGIMALFGAPHAHE